MTDISVVIVTYNSEGVIRRALRSLPEEVDTVVVDNASTDRSVIISEEVGARVHRNMKNVGFGAGCNIGASLSDKPYIFFLNPDAELFEGALETLLHALTTYPDAGAVAPALLTSSGTQTWRYQSILHPYPPNAPKPAIPEAVSCVPLLTGAAILCRRDVFKEIGGFDKNIFLYFEDDDLSRRIADAGYSLLHVPEAQVKHDFGESSGHSMRVTRFKYRQRLIAQSYICGKYGLTFDRKYMKTKHLKRLSIALLKADKMRVAAALGQLDALKEISNLPMKHDG